jgi:hypothetical protein
MNILNRQLVMAALLLCAGGASAADEVTTAALESAVEAGFSELEGQIIGDYYSDQAGGQTVTEGAPAASQASGGKSKPGKDKNKQGVKGQLPQGLAKRDHLPPGLERQLQKNGTLPPGLAKRSLPAELERRLPPTPEGYERQIIEDSTIVLVETATERMVDIITDAILGQSE